MSGPRPVWEEGGDRVEEQAGAPEESGEQKPEGEGTPEPGEGSEE